VLFFGVLAPRTAAKPAAKPAANDALFIVGIFLLFSNKILIFRANFDR
jgi:hypothetical protein